jgi:hypothetical protein
MSRDLKLLERHFRHWHEEGLLSPELESTLRQSSGQLVQRTTATIVRTALGGLGGGLLLAGLILIVAEDWEALHRSLKLGGWALLQLALLFCAYQLSRAWPERPALAEALSFVAGGWMLGGIALVSQIYQLDSRPPNGIWLWLVLALPAAWLLKQRAIAAIRFVALVWALALEAGQIDSIFRANRIDGPWVWIGIPLLAAGLSSFLPLSARFIREWTRFWTFVAGNLFLLVLGASQDLDRSDLGRGWWLAGAGILVGIAIPGRCLSRAWDTLTSRLILASQFLPWILLGSRYDAGVIRSRTNWPSACPGSFNSEASRPVRPDQGALLPSQPARHGHRRAIDLALTAGGRSLPWHRERLHGQRPGRILRRRRDPPRLRARTARAGALGGCPLLVRGLRYAHEARQGLEAGAGSAASSVLHP